MQSLAFIQTLAPMAQREQKRTGLLSSVTMAQGALESAFGTHAPGNNLFGIKGTGQELNTREYVNGHFVSVVAGFRTYDSWAGSVIDHTDFLRRYVRYAGVWSACLRMDWHGACVALHE